MAIYMHFRTSERLEPALIERRQEPAACMHTTPDRRACRCRQTRCPHPLPPPRCHLPAATVHHFHLDRHSRWHVLLHPGKNAGRNYHATQLAAAIALRVYVVSVLMARTATRK